ncbi:MAG TPA: carbon-nitrogen hydrolase family protein [Clostridia bacterium]
MKIAVINSTTVKDFALSQLQKVGDVDIIIFAFGVTGDVDLAQELSGESKTYAELVLLSITKNCIVIAGMDTNFFGIKHKSTIVIEEGHILDIHDMVHIFDQKYERGKGFKIYDTQRGKFGLIIHNDILFPETSRLLAVCDCDMLITLIDYGLPKDSMIMARSASLSNGLFNVCSEPGSSYLCDQNGAIRFYTKKNFLEMSFDLKKDKSMLKARQKDKYKEIFSNFL